jgi:internalin A
VRRVLRVVSAEVVDCPRLFTITRERAAGKRINIFQQHYRLTLWCEHPGHLHAWKPARYNLSPPKDWFAQISPYAMLIFKMLQLVVPIAGGIGDVLLSSDQFAQARSELELMSKVVADLPTGAPKVTNAVGLSERADSTLTPAEGQALRMIRVVLFERDHLRSFGGMCRVQAPSGEFLWVCPEHYFEYDPGLPNVP